MIWILPAIAWIGLGIINYGVSMSGFNSIWIGLEEEYIAMGRYSSNRQLCFWGSFLGPIALLGTFCVFGFHTDLQFKKPQLKESSHA